MAQLGMFVVERDLSVLNNARFAAVERADQIQFVWLRSQAETLLLLRKVAGALFSR